MRISAGFAFRRVARAFFALALPFVFRAAPVFASDAALLSKLAERGTLGVSEVLEIKKLSARIPSVAPSMQRPLRVSAKMQAQYEYISAECLEGGAEGGDSAVGKFIIRRMILTVNSDKNLDWGAQLSFDFMFANKTSITYLWRKIDAELLKGELRIGYIKPNFCFEENMSPFDLYAVERSVATYFWTGPRNARRLGFGSFMTGAYWFGEPREIRGLRYALGVSNSENYRLGFNSVSGGNAPNLWLSSSYSFDCFGAKADVGGNFGWGADADKTSSGPSAGMWGANPYVSVRLGGMRAMSEFLAAGADDGAMLGGGCGRQFPIGANFAVEYKFDIGEFGEIAPVFRFAYLDTDGRGVSPSDGLRQAANVDGDSEYERARGFYFGLNWYINGNSLKFQCGYERSHFSGGKPAAGGHSLAADSFRMQIQALF